MTKYKPGQKIFKNKQERIDFIVKCLKSRSKKFKDKKISTRLFILWQAFIVCEMLEKVDKK